MDGATPGLRRVPAPDLDAVGQEDALVDRLRDEIRRDGPIPFARFMDVALYDPNGGYYRSTEVRPGPRGDFVTAPELHPIFGWTLARVLDDAWRRMDRPDPFVLREPGAGIGTLGLTVLEGLQREGSELFGALRFDPVEVEPRRLEAIEARFTHAGWEGRLVGAGESGEAIVGAIVANEVLDALPVHRVTSRDGVLREVLVGLDGDRFIDLEGAPTTEALTARLDAEGVALAEGQQAEVCLELDRWVADQAGGLARGLMLVFDYGAPATELYDARRRPAGTLRAYLRQRVHDDPYAHVGRQDLTAHVDLTALERAAAKAGLAHLGTTSQAEFLIGSGMELSLASIREDPRTTTESWLAVRSSVMRLIDPAAMGRFRVAGFGRAWPSGPPLPGFAYRGPRRSADRTGPHQTPPD